MSFRRVLLLGVCVAVAAGAAQARPKWVVAWQGEGASGSANPGREREEYSAKSAAEELAGYMTRVLKVDVAAVEWKDARRT